MMKRSIFLLALLSLISVVLATQQESRGQYLVRFKSAPDNKVRSLTNMGNKVKILKEFTVAKRATWLVEGQKLDVDKLRQSSLVAWIEENVQYTLPTNENPRIAKWSNGHVMKSKSEECQVQVSENGEDIWGLIRTSYEDVPYYNGQGYKYLEDGEGVDIYVVDTGVDREHPDLDGRVQEGFVAEGVREEGHADLFGHGTYVASIAAGSFYGAAKEARIIPVKVMGKSGGGSMSDIVQGIEWVTERVGRQREENVVPRAIINLSLGGGQSMAFYESLLHASKMGIAIIVAAGNNNGDAREFYPAGYNVSIAIGASDAEDNAAEFSNHGCKVALYSPGVDITGAWSTQSEVMPCEEEEASHCIKTMSGTSAAAPLAAGVLARWMSGFNNDQMWDFIEEPSYYQDLLTSTSIRGRLTFPNEEIAELSNNALLHKSCGMKEWDRNNRIPICWTAAPTTHKPVETTTRKPVEATTTTRATPTTTSPHPSTTITSVADDSLSTWEILGITAACVACVLLTVVVVMLCRRPAPASPPAPQMAFSNHGYANGPAVLVVDNKGSLPTAPPVYEEFADKQAAKL